MPNFPLPPGAPTPVQAPVKKAGSASILLLRAIGILIMLGGFYSAYQLASRAWLLLDKPDVVSNFAQEIDKQSNLNAYVSQINILVDFVNKARAMLPGASATSPESVQNPQLTTNQAIPQLNASYFVAWFLTLVLLAVISRITLWAIKEGGKLAMYLGDRDEQLKEVLSSLIHELRMTRLQ